MPINPSEAGKGDGRRREDAAKVESNWPSDWDARERERLERERRQQQDGEPLTP